MQFQIDPQSGVPFYRQIIEQVRFAIARGDLRPGEQLPTVRRLAVELSINPNTVVRAYRELELAGTLETHQGSGTFVGPQPSALEPKEARRVLDQLVTEMLARASSYGFTIDEVHDALLRHKETTS